jgi:hypothetical protein
VPNHVANRLCITGPKKDRDAFLATLNKPGYGDRPAGEFCFHQIVPMPSIVRRDNMSFDEMQKNPNNWYNWSIANWGTKWSNYDTSSPEIGSKSIKIRFLTAWSPPDVWMETASKAFPTLKFCNKWKDEGGPSGTHTFRNGFPA